MAMAMRSPLTVGVVMVLSLAILMDAVITALVFHLSLIVHIQQRPLALERGQMSMHLDKMARTQRFQESQMMEAGVSRDVAMLLAVERMFLMKMEQQ